MLTRGDRDVFSIALIPSRKVLVVDHTIKDAPVRDSTSRVALAMASKLRVNATANVVEMFMQTLVALQTTPMLNSGFVTCCTIL
ncbi:hypothetical protein TNCV_4872941 [Trichonephila clavipes]|nr:hypothetical protein TNCV_4872941 [Trichonephila clavipes]